jgi:hypothetical protein
MRSTLLVTHKYLLEIVLMVEHSIKHGHDTATRITEYGINPLVYECLHKSF